MPTRKSLLKKTEVETPTSMRVRASTVAVRVSSGPTCLVVFDGPRRTRFCYSREIGLKMIHDAKLLLGTIETRLLGDGEEDMA